jgi:hypothetical protein
MPSEAAKPRPKREANAAILVAVILLLVMGSAALFMLGQPLPQEDAAAPLAWGDRVERRMDAFIDGRRPEWADAIEARMKGLKGKIGWN